jgi:hypothetical protein
MTDKIISLEVDAQTGKSIERELTLQEVTDREKAEAEAKAKDAEATAKTAARTSALAKLAELGLTAEEIAAL